MICYVICYAKLLSLKSPLKIRFRVEIIKRFYCFVRIPIEKNYFSILNESWEYFLCTEFSLKLPLAVNILGLLTLNEILFSKLFNYILKNNFYFI